MKDPDVTQFSMTRDCDGLQLFIKLHDTDGEHSVKNYKEITYARKFFGLPKVKLNRR